MRYDVAVMDVKLTAEMKKDPTYKLWHGMIYRCYSPEHLERRPTYKGCSVCTDWLVFSNFRAWAEQKSFSGMHLDKDLKIPGNKVYSPETCLLVSPAVNTLFAIPKGDGLLPLGVREKKSTSRYLASISYRGKDKHLGYFKTIPEAETAYKNAKREIVLEYAHESACPEVKAALLRIAQT